MTATMTAPLHQMTPRAATAASGGTAWRERAGDPNGHQSGDPNGGAVTLVMLHGIGSDAVGFDALVPHLPEGWRLLAWDMPGYGASADLTQDWPVARDYAARLAGWLDATQAERPVLLGHSLGALVAAAYARHWPDRASALVLASCALGHGVAQGGLLSAASAGRIAELQALGPDDFAARRAPGLVFQPDRNPDTVARVRRAMSGVRMPGYGQAARMLASGALVDDLAHATAPVSVIVGEGDTITPPDANRRAHAAVPSALRGPLTELPGAGHAIYQQAPAAFAAALKDAVAAMTAGPAPTVSPEGVPT